MKCGRFNIVRHTNKVSPSADMGPYRCTWLTQQPRLQTFSEQWCPPWLILVVDDPQIRRLMHCGQRNVQFVIMHHMFRRPVVPQPLMQNLQQLCENIQAAWDGLSEDIIRNLYRSISRHLACCASKHGSLMPTERHYFCMCSSINIAHIKFIIIYFLVTFYLPFQQHCNLTLPPGCDNSYTCTVYKI